jgi:hypothetical protein
MKKKALAMGLVAALAVTAVPAMAASTYQNSTGNVDETVNVTEDKTENCTVYAEVGSSFKVTIPKKITMAGDTKTGAYTVAVEGDIAGDEYVTVVPAASFAMKQTGKADVTVTIKQENQKFRGDNFTGVLAEDEKLMATGSNGALYGDGSNESGKLTAGSCLGSGKELRWERAFTIG